MDVDEIIDRQPVRADRGAAGGDADRSPRLLVTLLFKRIVLDRLARLESAVRARRGGRFTPSPTPITGNDEIGRLSRAFAEHGARRSATTPQVLEAIVRERTAELRAPCRSRSADRHLQPPRLHRSAFERERNRAGRQRPTLGLLLIDIDLFKTDQRQLRPSGRRPCARRGRAAGSASSSRSYDICAPLGRRRIHRAVGDCDAATLQTIADEIRDAIGADADRHQGRGRDRPLTVSIGACLVAEGATIGDRRQRPTRRSTPPSRAAATRSSSTTPPARKRQAPPADVRAC